MTQQSDSAAEFADHFSGHAADYRRFRPRYPADLFRWLAAEAPGRDLAWDAGTGNGQAAVDLATHFPRVIATDPSREQLGNAEPHAHVEYRLGAESLPECESGSVDLVTVAQAVHWFRLDRFYAEVQRVLRPGGLLAVWTYRRTMISDAVDPVVRRFQHETVGPYWPPERVLVESEYRDLPFPFARMDAPVFEGREPWDAPRFIRYVETWSAVKNFQRRFGRDPVREFAPELIEAWGDADEMREVRFPLILVAGRKP